MSCPDSSPPEARSRWGLIRDLLVFQLKLGIDAFRDVVLVPISLVAAVVDLVKGGDHPKRFYEIVRLGRRSERWIDLFGAVEPPEEDDLPSLDSLVGHVERLLVEQVKRGGVTASAKEAIDRSLNRISDLGRTRSSGEGGATSSVTRSEDAS